MRRAWGFAAVALLMVASACGGGGSKTASTTTTRVTPTTIAPLAVTVTPPSGAVGTAFTFKVQGFESGEHLHFEVVFPDGRKPFVGQSHPVNADGTYAAPYSSTKGNPLGTYTVKAIGDQGSTAEGTFELTSGTAAPGSPTTTSKSGSSTTETLPGD